MAARPHEAIAGGPRAGLTELFERERHAMFRMATLIVGSRDVAEEVVQDAFASIGEHWATVDRPGAYLRRSVINGCSQIIRRRELDRRVEPLLRIEPPEVLPGHLLELRDALDSLSERQRIVIVLRYFVDVHDDEIAEILAVRPSTIRSLARRAFVTLREELQ